MHDQPNLERTDYSSDPPYRIIRKAFRPGRVTVFVYDQHGNRNLDEEVGGIRYAASTPSAADNGHLEN